MFKIIIPKITNEQLAAVKSNAISKAIKQAGRMLRKHFEGQTEAARLIAAMPPMRFPMKRADRLGDACVRELEGID